MFWKKHRKALMLSLAFALGIGSFLGTGGQAEAASVMDLFNQVYKRATGSDFQGFDSIRNGAKPQKPVQPQPEGPNPVEPENPNPVEPEEPNPVEPAEPEEPVNPQEPEQPKPQPQPKPENPIQANLASRIIATGDKYLGTPYKYGAPYGQTNTFDCSSFTKTVFAENGITLPRSTRQQVNVGKPISRNELQKGDLIFTRTSYSSNVSHVAIYAGDGMVLHTYGPGGVRYDKFKGSWLDRAYITARRVIE